MRLPTKTVLQYPTLMRSSRRDHSIDVADNIYECLSGLCCCCFFFQITNFSERFGLWEVAVYGFSGIFKKILKKNSVMKSRFINVAKRRI